MCSRKIGKANITFRDTVDLLIFAGSKATGSSVLFPEEDKALLQASQSFHALNCVNGKIGVIQEPNKN